MIHLDEALRVVLEQVPELETESVALADAGGAWLQETVRSDVEQPPADVSAMDGFALQAADAAQVPAELTVVGEVPAGVPAEISVEAGQAVRIMTGAGVPPGADSVQMVEHTKEADGKVRILKPVREGAHIRRRGENIHAGETLLDVGQRLGAAEIGLLAGAGKVTVAVRRRPEVAIVPTGDELVEPGTTPAPGQIRNSNGYSLQRQVQEEGGTSFYLGIGRDQATSLEDKIAQGLEHDLLLLCGGVSMGKYDLVKPALERLGVEILFEKIAVKPGKPTVFGVHRPAGGRQTMIFGLPGNPVSGMVIFQLLVAPAMRRMQGAPRPVSTPVLATLTEDARSASGRECFLPASVAWVEGGFQATPVLHRGSGDLVAWRGANAMIHLAAGEDAGAGETVRVFLARDRELR